MKLTIGIDDKEISLDNMTEAQVINTLDLLSVLFKKAGVKKMWQECREEAFKLRMLKPVRRRRK